MTAPSLREAATMALDALIAMQMEATARGCGLRVCDDSIEALRAALALPDAEPVAWAISYMGADGLKYRRLFGHNAIGDYRDIDPDATSTPLYAAPQPAPVRRKPLSEARISQIWGSFVGDPTARHPLTLGDKVAFARAVIDAHNIQGAA